MKYIIKCTFFAFFVSFQIDAVLIKMVNRSGFKLEYEWFAENPQMSRGRLTDFEDIYLTLNQHGKGIIQLGWPEKDCFFEMRLGGSSTWAFIEALIEDAMLHIYVRNKLVFSQSVNSMPNGTTEFVLTKEMLLPHLAAD